MSTRQVQPLDLATLLRDPIRRARAQSRKNIEDDDENARLAIHHLEKSIKEFEQVNKAIAEDHRSFVNDLAKEKDWLSSTKEWDREDEEWRQGEMATRLYNLKEATKAGNFHSLRFVQDFFQQKHMSLDRMGNIEIECHLYREVLQIEMERSKIVRGHHRKRKEHDKRVNDLLKEIEDLENLIRKRVRVYEEITEGLKQLGVEQTKLNELDEEMEKVKTTSHECTKTRKDCTKVYETGNRNLQQSRYQVQELLRSSRNFISHVEHMEEQLKSQQEAQESLLAKMMTGALYGASVGNQFIPVIGIIPGGIIGGVGSLIKGLFKDNERLTRQLQDSIENNRRMIQNCGEILTRANTERDELSLTLLDDC